MIPKTIHYCWFGNGEKPKLAQKCISSWRKFCPDYDIIEWNENSFDINYNQYTRYCYDHKKWAFLSDFVRLFVLEKFGGIYLDTDVELIKSFDEMLKYEAFYGFENKSYVNTGQGFGSEAGHAVVEAMKEQYTQLRSDKDGSFTLVACPRFNTEALVKMGLILDGNRQNISGAEILPMDFLNPYDDPTGKLKLTDNTIGIHWYSKSWMSKEVILRSKLTKPFHRIFGSNCFRWLKS